MLKLNDKVKLNSGSPALTVVSLHEGKATVQWKVEGEVRSVTLPEVCFTKL